MFGGGVVAVLSPRPVAGGLLSFLNVSALLAIAPGGVWGDLPQTQVYPCVLLDVSEDRSQSGLGTKPGTGGSLLQVDLRVHVFSRYGGMKECQAVMAKVIELLNVAVTVNGYTFCGTEPFLDEV